MKGRSKPLALAAAAAFLSMVVVMVLKTFADTVFLAEYGIKYVPHFFVAQAVAMIAASSGYSALIRRGPSRVADLSILGITGACGLVAPLAVWAGAEYVFVIALALVMLSGLSALVVWNAATSVVSGRQMRSFVPRAGAAATLGAVVGGFGSSAIVAISGVLSLATVAGVLCGALIVMQLRLMGLARAHSRARSKRRKQHGPRRALSPSSKRLVVMLIVATIVESLLNAFIDYSFKREVSATLDRDAMGMFFALFYGGVNVALLALQLLVSSKILASKSLKLTLSIQPIGLAIAGLAWAVSPVLALAALGRGVEMIGKFSFARPGQEIALTPLRDADRQRWKVLLRGVFSQGGAVVGGMVLIIASPVLGTDLYIAPMCIGGLAIAWLIAQELVAARYLDSLGSELGMLGLSVKSAREDLHLDRDGLAKVIELVGDERDEVARFGRELLRTSVEDTSVLAPHLSNPSPRVRRVLYQLLAKQPTAVCLPLIRRAITHEVRDAAALAAAFSALSAYGDRSAIAMARSSCGSLDDLRGDDATSQLASAAWSYLAQSGALDDDPPAHTAVLAALLPIDGVAAAGLYDSALAREQVTETEIDAALVACMTTSEPKAVRQGLRAAAALGRSKPLVQLLKALDSNVPGAQAAIGYLDSAGLGRLSMLANARKAAPRLRARLIRAIGTSELPEASEVAARALMDPDATVREIATHTLQRLVREHQVEPPRDIVDRALHEELDRFSVYVRARPSYSDKRESSIVFRRDSAAELDAEMFFLDELERRTEAALSRVCGLLALQGNPETVYAAERALRAPTFRSRHQGLDILQEVARGSHRTQLFELLEIYLQPPRHIDDDARNAVKALDPWLARCTAPDIAQLRYRLWGLRSTSLFDLVDGESLAALAEHTTLIEADADSVIVEQGAPGDALYIVMSGSLSVVRDGEAIARLAAGQSFGEFSLVDGEPRGATVRSIKPARLLRLPRKPYQAALQAHPAIGLGLVRGLAKWLRRAGAQATRRAANAK